MTQLIAAFATEFWEVLTTMAPYLLLGFAAAGLLSVWISPETVDRHLGARHGGAVAKAALFGMPLPLCSCGVLPVAASLRRHGASRGATTSFLLSTPQTGVDSILVTWSLLGPLLAIFRPVIALLTGLVGGFLVNRLEPTEASAGSAPRPAPALDAHSHEERVEGSWLRRAWIYGFVTLPRDIGRALVVGLIVAGLIAVVVPPETFSGALGSGWLSKLAMMALSIPLYVCATASVPVAAALIAKGISPGAALVFLIAGPATNAAAITTIWRILGQRIALVYLGVVAVSALGFGWLLDWFAIDLGIEAAVTIHHHHPGLFGHASGVALLALLVVALWPHPRSTRTAAVEGDISDRLEVTVGGMTCSHCATSIRQALVDNADAVSVDVDLVSGRVRIAGKDLDRARIRQAIEAAGYQVESIAGD